MIKEHWGSFPHNKSHYGRQKTERKFYDNPDLNIKILYDLCEDYYQEKTGKIFRSNTIHIFSVIPVNIHLGPQKQMCATFAQNIV